MNYIEDRVEDFMTRLPISSDSLEFLLLKAPYLLISIDQHHGYHISYPRPSSGQHGFGEPVSKAQVGSDADLHIENHYIHSDTHTELCLTGPEKRQKNIGKLTIQPLSASDTVEEKCNNCDEMGPTWRKAGAHRIGALNAGDFVGVATNCSRYAQ